MKMPDGLEFWTPDEVAECLAVSTATYRRLWEVLADLEWAGKAVPLGGDGSDGTIETPPEPDAYPEGKMGAVWRQLTEAERTEIAEAFKEAQR